MDVINRAKILKRALVNRLSALVQKPASAFHHHQESFLRKSGIEIGGPSQVFSGNGIFPVYPMVQHLDNCNFHDQTVWEGPIKTGANFVFDKRKAAGQQFIAEATALDFIPDGQYDFLLSSHVLEHIANPIEALQQWLRLLRNRGMIVLVLPDSRKTFDHRRPITPLSHMIADYEKGVAEDDLTHLPEILALHDLSRDPEAGNADIFKARALENLKNRCLHHHVFDIQSATGLIEFMGLRIESAEELPPHHILVLGRKAS